LNRGARVLLTIPAIAALVGLSVLALRVGCAETLAYRAASEIDSWAASRSQPGIDTWLWVRADLQRAAAMSANDPGIQELLGVLHARRAGRQEFVEVALEHFSKAASLRPSSPYTWANIAVARYELGKTDSRLEEIIAGAARLGPQEPEVHRTVTDLGLALWDEIAPKTRVVVERMIGAGMRRNPMEILQISERRGRLEPACQHVSGNPRITDPKWVNLCERGRQI